ncbi:MAG: hypothetical protein ABSC17_01040 [Thermacetogeniaceae bacterium]
MTAKPVEQGIDKTDLVQELQNGSKTGIVERLLGNKALAYELAANTSPDEALIGESYPQIIL